MALGKDFSWLAAAERSLRRDLNTSEKELRLIRHVLDESGMDLAAPDASGGIFKDRMFCMRACKEYSGSRVHMLQERIRQIQIWSSSKRMGKEIPDRIPDEWLVVDIEWRQWLGKQTTLQTNNAHNAHNEESIDSLQSETLDTAVNIWGPLIPLLEIYTG